MIGAGRRAQRSPVLITVPTRRSGTGSDEDGPNQGRISSEMLRGTGLSSA